MNLESDKRLNIQLRLDFSSAPTGEARQALREDIESLPVVHEPERPANTSRIICSKRVSVTSRTAVYGPVRTVVWEGRSREAPPYPDRATGWQGEVRWARHIPIYPRKGIQDAVFPTHDHENRLRGDSGRDVN